MNKTIVTSMLAAAVAILCAAGMTFAKSSNVTLMYESKIGNHLTLQPGQYKVTVIDNAKTPKASFYRNSKLVGQAPVKLVSQAKKTDQTAIYYSAPHNHVREITEIQLNGWRQNLMFPTSNSSSKSD